MTAAVYGVRAMPTFLFFKNGNKVDEMNGGDPVTLESKIKQWIGATNKIVRETLVCNKLNLYLIYVLTKLRNFLAHKRKTFSKKPFLCMYHTYAFIPLSLNQ